MFGYIITNLENINPLEHEIAGFDVLCKKSGNIFIILDNQRKKSYKMVFLFKIK